MKKFLKFFLQGLLIMAPIAITIYITLKVIIWIDSMFPGLPFGVGILITLVAITFVGFLSNLILFQPIFMVIENLIERIPFVKIIYTSLKDLFAAFVTNQKKFKHPVLVKINHDGTLQKLGFISQEDLSNWNIHDKMAVYLPHSFNFSGNLFFVSKENITRLEGISGTEAMKFIVSGGMTSVNSIK